MPLGYCKVRVNITALVKDGNDSDIAPDEQALSGQLKLVPMVKPGTPLQYDDGGRKKLKVLTALENIEIGPMGDIVNGAVDFVTVPAPDASNTNIAALQWQAIFVNPKYGNKIVAINDIFFWAVAGVDIDLADQVNTAPSSTAVQITRGPRGFGVVDAQIDADELVFYAGPQDDPDAWLEAGRVPAPSGGSVADGGVTTAKLANDAVARAKLAEEVRTELEGKLSQTTADTRYAPIGAVGGLDPAALAAELSNPETPASDAVSELISASLIGYAQASDVAKKHVIGDNLGASRPAGYEALPVNWYTTVVGGTPTNVIAGDEITVYEASAIVDLLVASDDFNRADGPMGVTPVGLLTWTRFATADGDIAIESNTASVSGGTSGNAFRVVTAPTPRILTVCTVANQVTAYGAMTFRFQDIQNYFVLARVSSTVQQYRLIKRIANVSTDVKVSTIPMATGDVISIDDRVLGKLKILINGVTMYDQEVDTAVPATELNTVATVGLYAGTVTAPQTNIAWENFSITKAA